MKKIMIVFGLVLSLGSARAQSVADCIQQLVLDYQKLAQMKNVLTEMYRGYEVLTKGYNAVKNVAQGNFSVHQVFLDGLYLVSPTVRKYPKVREIISGQAQLVTEYRSAKRRLGSGLSPDEWQYLMNVFDGLVGRSLDNLDALTLVMSDNQLRMGDAERLRLIDQLHQDSVEQLSYLRKINEQTTQLLARRSAAAAEKQSVRQLYGIK